MISVSSVLYTLVLFSELSSHLVTVAMPATKVEDGATEQDGLGLLLRDEPMIESMTEPMSDPAVVPLMYSRSLLDNNVRDEDGRPNVIIVSDMRLKGHGIRGLNPTFTRSLPLLAERSLSRTPAEPGLKIDRRENDLDMLRCMIGRVYRPCWNQ